MAAITCRQACSPPGGVHRGHNSTGEPSGFCQPAVLICLSPVWTGNHETAKRLAQRIKTVLDVAMSKGFRFGENPVTAIKDAQVLPGVTAKVTHHKAMAWQDVPALGRRPASGPRGA